MLIGVPKEIKAQENRVGMTPLAVSELTNAGHSVLVETNAGQGIHASDQAYVDAGADIAGSAADVFAKAEMIVKVKEPQTQECAMLREGQILFTYLHLAADKPQTEALMKSGAVCIAYETVTGRDGGLPLLAPMSEVAGRLAIQAGAWSLERAHGGRGLLLGGVPGVPGAQVLIIGGGMVGRNALAMAVGAGAQVTILDRSIAVLREIDALYGNRVTTRIASSAVMDEELTKADLVVGAVLLPGASAPKLIKRAHLPTMKNGAVIVDVAIDQGGICDTSKATTHAEPVYVIDDVVHYCVANMPGAVPHTSTYALGNATLSHTRALADLGWKQAFAQDPHLAAGLNVLEGNITYKAVADALDLPFKAASF